MKKYVYKEFSAPEEQPASLDDKNNGIERRADIPSIVTAGAGCIVFYSVAGRSKGVYL